MSDGSSARPVVVVRERQAQRLRGVSDGAW